VNDAQKSYALVTAAYNEEAYIETTIQSVIAQTMRPLRWTIVSDGSTDRTDAIVQSYTARHPFIQLMQVRDRHTRNFAAQVHAINLGCSHLRSGDYRFIGNVDADVSFEPTYYSRLLAKFDEDPQLGLAGGFICEEKDGKFKSRRTNSVRSVAHAVQMFRRECFESVGGYVALKYGSPDWHAEVVARMHGWRVEAFPQLQVFHHRPTGSADRLIRYRFWEGLMDHSLGSSVLFEILKLARRIPSKPFALGALARFIGFCWGHCHGEKREVSEEFVTFVRNEEKERISSFFHGLFGSSTNSKVYSVDQQ